MINLLKIYNRKEKDVVTKEERKKELAEMDRIAKMLVRRDLALSEIRESRDKEFQELQKKTKELEDSRKALINILEDVEEARCKSVEEKNKTLAIITNFADGLLVFDDKYNLSLMNPKAEGFFNVREKNLINQHVSKLGAVKSLNALVMLLSNPLEEIIRKELAIKKNLILEVSAAPVMREKVKTGTLVVLHDITREKMIEKTKTEFVSLAAHQLRTPLSAIKWSLRMLLDGDLGNITEKQKNLIHKTFASNEKMINLVNGLLDVTKIEEGRYLYKTTLAQIKDIIQFVINSCKEEIRRRGLKVKFEKPIHRVPKIKVDVERMRLAIQNVLDNAIRYTPVNGIIKIRLERKGNQIQCEIKDSGIGIPDDQQARVFSKFFRGANAIKTETQGSGLGVFIAKNIIEAHEGRIWFKSKQGKGTSFYFTLPITH